MERYEVRMRWAAMLDRCENPNHNRYSDYGGRGVTVCPEWQDFETFYLWAISAGIQAGLQIDRINNDGPYSPTNCRYSSRKENSRNTRRTKILTIFGETKSVPEWAEDDRCNTTLSRLRKRLLSGWNPEDALTVSDPKLVEAFGQRKRLSEWISDPRCVVSPSTVKDRYYKRGWPVEDCLTLPFGNNSSTHRKDNLWYTAFGEEKVLTHWSRDYRCEVSYDTLRRRTAIGISLEQAMKKLPQKKS